MIKNGEKIIILTVFLIILFCSNAYAGPVGYLTTPLPESVEYTPAADIFRFADSGEEFILLDYDEKDGFFVTTKGFMGTHIYDSDATGKFDLYDENNMAYWLNNDFIINGNVDPNTGVSRELPEVVLRNIHEHEWLCEAGNALSDFPEDYIVRAKLALMSLTEYKKYAGKIGVLDNIDVSYYYFLRTVNGTAADSPVMVIYSNRTANYGKAYNAYGVRPVFYLDKEVFIKEKLNVTASGDNVIQQIRSVYTKEELEKTYSQTELEGIFRKTVPQVSEVNVSGVQRAGNTLKASYKYSSLENEKEGDTVIRWLRTKNKKGPYSVINGAEELEYQLTNNDAGYYVICEVTPVSYTKRMGITIRSAFPPTQVKPSTRPYAENARIRGKALIGERLIADYEFVDNNDSVELGTAFEWQKSNDNTEYEKIQGENGANLIIPNDCKDCYIRCIITVHNESEDGAAVITEPIGPVSIREKSEKKPPIILREGVCVVLKTPVENRNRIVWISENKEGSVKASLGSSLYMLSGNEKKVSALVLCMDKHGNLCGVNKSNSINPENADDVIIKESVNVNGNETICISAGKELFAHSIKLKISSVDAKILEAKSEEFDIYTYQNDNEVTYILTKKSVFDESLPETIMEISTSGSGIVKIEAAEAAYDAGNGKTVKYTPEFSVLGGNKR